MIAQALRVLLAAATIFCIVAYLVFGNFFALAALGGVGVIYVLSSQLRVFTLPLLFFLEFVVFTLGYGTNTFLGFRLGYFDILLFIAFVYFMLIHLTSPAERTRPIPYLPYFAFYLLFAGLATLLNPGYFDLSMRSLQLYVIEPPMLVFLAYFTVRNREDLRLNVLFISAVLLLVNLMYIRTIWSLTGSLTPTSLTQLGELKEVVAGPLFTNKNAFGSVQIVLLPILVGYALVSRRILSRVWLWLAAISSLLAINNTLSRGVVVSIGLAFLLVMVLKSRKRLLAAMSGSFFLLVAVAVAVASGTFELYAQRATSGDINRLELISYTFELLRRHPFMGIGPTEFHFIDALREFAQVGTGFVFAHPHNSYLQLASFLGIPALLVIMALLGVHFLRLWQVTELPGNRLLGLSFLVSHLAFYLDMGTDFVFFHNHSAHAFWFVFGLSIVWMSLKGDPATTQDANPLESASRGRPVKPVQSS